MLSNPVLVLAYVVAAAVVVPAVALLAFGRLPSFLQGRSAPSSQTRTRMEAIGLLLIGCFILADALAADLGRRSTVPQDWVLLVWIALAAGLIGIRYLAGRASATGKKTATPR